MSGEHPSHLGDTDYREIAEEIAEEMKESYEGLVSSKQPSASGDSDYREITEEIVEEIKEPDERLLSSEKPGTRSSGVLDEIIAGLIMAGILYVFGVVSGVLEGAPLAWLANSRSTSYLVVSIALMGVALIAYVAWQSKRR